MELLEFVKNFIRLYGKEEIWKLCNRMGKKDGNLIESVVIYF